MRKIVINKCYGGFGLSNKAVSRLRELGRDVSNLGYAEEADWVDHNGRIKRDDKFLVQVVEELGAEASGGFAELTIVEIPNNVKWHIEEYDGMEHVAEDHRTWG